VIGWISQQKPGQAVLLFRQGEKNQEVHMRLALIGLVTATAALAADVQSASAGPASAYPESFYQKRFCAIGGRGNSGIADCSYNTWPQSVESARGTGRHCTENYPVRGDGPTTQGRAYRHRDY